MITRLTSCAGLVVLCIALSGCYDGRLPAADAPPGHARLDSGASQTGNSPNPAGGGQAAVGVTPNGAITTTPTR